MLIQDNIQIFESDLDEDLAFVYRAKQRTVRLCSCCKKPSATMYCDRCRVVMQNSYDIFK